jgi:hypothetical protein
MLKVLNREFLAPYFGELFYFCIPSWEVHGMLALPLKHWGSNEFVRGE